MIKIDGYTTVRLYQYSLIENYILIIIVLVIISLRNLLVFISVHHISWKWPDKDGELYSLLLNISDRKEIFGSEEENSLCPSGFVEKEVGCELLETCDHTLKASIQVQVEENPPCHSLRYLAMSQIFLQKIVTINAPNSPRFLHHL